MSLTLGKQFDRNYNLRIPFLDSFCNIYIFFSKKSPLVLYNINQDDKHLNEQSTQVRMFKNLSGSTFCETFLTLHNYRKNNLDIINQFDNIKSEFSSEILFICNESINLSKIKIEDRTLFDTLTVYGFTLASYLNEYIFIISERQYIDQNINKKIVRTSGIELGTSNSFEYIKDINTNIKKDGIIGIDQKDNKSNKVIKLED